VQPILKVFNGSGHQKILMAVSFRPYHKEGGGHDKEDRYFKYRNIRKKELTFDRKLVVFTGESGIGKTSVLNAIKFGLLGNAGVSDITSGEDRASVAVTFDDGATIERIRDQKTNSVRIKGSSTTNKSAEDYLSKKIAPKSVLEAALNVDYFEGLSKKDLTSLFLGIIPGTLTTESVLNLCGQHLGSPLSDECRKLITAKLTEVTMDPVSPFGLPVLKQVYDILVDDRVSAKRNVRELTMKTSEAVQKPVKAIDEYRRELEEIISKETLAKKYAAEYSSYAAALDAYNKAGERIKALKAELAKLGDIAKPEESERKLYADERKRFVNAISQCRSSQATLNANIRMFKKTLVNLDKPVCPISEKLICSTDKSGIKSELEELIKKNTEELNKNIAFTARCEEQVAKRDKRIEDFMNRKALYERKLSFEAQIKTLSDLKEPVKPVKPEIPGDIDARKRELNGMISGASRYEEYEKNCLRLAVEKKRLENIETAAGLFDVKKGIYPIILERILKPLEDMCNVKAETYRKGFKVKLELDEGIEVRYSADGTQFLPMANASASEYMFIAFLIISVIGKLTDCRLLILDNIDKFDSKKAGNLFELLRKDDTFEQVFCATVDHEDITANLSMDEINYFHSPDK